MPSSIDPTKPADNVPASKADLRANLLAAKTEIEHGGFFTQPDTGAIERTVQARLQDAVSLKDFGGVGDGVTDNTTAFQNALSTQRAIYIPAGTYVLDSPIDYEAYGEGDITLIGERGTDTSVKSKIQGTSNLGVAPLFYRGAYLDDENNVVGTLPSGAGAHAQFIDMALHAAHERGSVAYIHGCSSPSGFFRCRIGTQFRGIYLANGFENWIVQTNFSNNYFNTTIGETYDEDDIKEAWSVYMDIHGTMTNSRVKGGGVAVRMGSNDNMACLYSRIESSWHAFYLGGPSRHMGTLDEHGICNAVVDNISLEACKQAIYVDRGSPQIQTVRCTGTQGAAVDGGNPDYGIFVERGEKPRVRRCKFDLHANRAVAVLQEPVQFEDCTFHQQRSGGALFEGETFVVQGNGDAFDKSPIPFINAPLNPYRNDARDADERVATYFPTMQLRGLKGIDMLNANVMPNNLGGLLPVTQDATSVAVGFIGGAGGTLGTLTLTPTTDGGSTLVAGDYVYGHTYIHPRGESNVNNVGDTNYKQVTVATGEKVAINAVSTVSRCTEHRIYRRLASSPNWEGFWQLPNTTSAMDDTGQAFDGAGGPPVGNLGYNSGYQHERDSNYAIVATPSWDTTCWITGKATTGFTLNFGTAAPVGATVQWLLFRP